VALFRGSGSKGDPGQQVSHKDHDSAEGQSSIEDPREEGSRAVDHVMSMLLMGVWGAVLVTRSVLPQHASQDEDFCQQRCLVFVRKMIYVNTSPCLKAYLFRR